MYPGCHNLTFAEVLLLCDASYGKNPGERVQSKTGTIWNVAHLAAGQFGGARFMHLRRLSDKQDVIAFAGTHMTELTDWVQNFTGALGFDAPQYGQAKSYVKFIMEGLSKLPVFVGHSLGGGLASLMAITFEGAAATIFPAPLSHVVRFPQLWKKERVVNYTCEGEVLTVLGNLRATNCRVGKDIPVKSKANDTITKHFLSNIIL